MSRRTVRAVLCWAACATLVYAQHHHELPPGAAKSAVRLLSGTGNLHHAVSTQNAEAQRDLQAFKTQAGVLAIIAAGSGSRLEFDGMTVSIPEGFTDHVQLKYTLDRSPSQGGPLPLWVNLARRRNELYRR